MSPEPVEVTPTDQETEGRWKATATERAFSFSAGSHLHGRQKPFPLRQTLPHITVTPQVIPEPGVPGLGPPSYILPQCPATAYFHSFLHNSGHLKTELSRETGGFPVASGISFRLPEEHFTKSQITWSLFSSLSQGHHLKHTRPIFSLLSFSLGIYSFFFSFSLFLKGNLRVMC